jgi:hypothetical protein
MCPVPGFENLIDIFTHAVQTWLGHSHHIQIALIEACLQADVDLMLRSGVHDSWSAARLDVYGQVDSSWRPR